MPDLTLDDIARMAGVSPSTVSRVLNNLVGTPQGTRGCSALAETISSQRRRALLACALAGDRPAGSRAGQHSQPHRAPAGRAGHAIVPRARHPLACSCSAATPTSSSPCRTAALADGLIVRGADDRASERCCAAFVAARRWRAAPAFDHVSYVAVDHGAAPASSNCSATAAASAAGRLARNLCQPGGWPATAAPWPTGGWPLTRILSRRPA